MTVCFMTMMSVVVMLVPEAFVKLFIDASRPENAAVLDLAVSFLFFAVFFQVADGIQEVMSWGLARPQRHRHPDVHRRHQLLGRRLSHWRLAGILPRSAGGRALARLSLWA